MLVRRGFQAFNTGDVETLSGIFADDAVQVMGGNNLLRGEHKGREAILSMYGRLAEHTGGTFQAGLQMVVANDSTAVAIYRGANGRARCSPSTLRCCSRSSTDASSS